MSLLKTVVVSSTTGESSQIVLLANGTLISCAICETSLHIIIYDTIRHCIIGTKEQRTRFAENLCITEDGKNLIEVNCQSVRISDFDKWIRDENDCVKNEWNFPTDNDSGVLAWVLDTALSPDGRRVALCGMDHRLCVFDVFSGSMLYEYHGKGSRYELRHPVFSSDGEHLALSGNNSTLYLFDLKHKTANLIPMPKQDVRPLAWTDNDNELLLTIHKKLVLYNVLENSSTEVYSPGKDCVWSAVINKDKTSLVLGLESGGSIYQSVIDIASQKELFRKPGNAIGNLFTDDGKYIYLGGNNGVTTFDRHTNTGKQLFEGHLNDIGGVRFLSDTDRTLLLFDGVTPRIINYISGEEKERLPGPVTFTRLAIISPDGKVLCTDNEDGEGFFFHDLVKNQTIKKIRNSNPECGGLIAPNMSYVTAGKYGGTVSVYTAPKGKKLFDLTGSKNATILAACFSDDSSLISAIDRNSVYQLFDTATGNIRCTQSLPDRQLWNPKIGFVSGNDYWYLQDPGSVEIYSLSSGELHAMVPLDRREVNDLYFHPCGSLLLIRSREKLLELVNWQSGETIRKDRLGCDGVTSFFADWDNNRLYYGYQNGEVRVFDTDTCEFITTIKTDSAVYYLEKSANLNLLAVQHERQTEIYDVITNTKTAVIPLHDDPYNKVCSALTFSFDWQYAAEVFECFLYVTHLTVFKE